MKFNQNLEQERYISAMILNVIERSVFCSPKLHLFDQKYSKNFKILLQFKIAVFYVNMC